MPPKLVPDNWCLSPEMKDRLRYVGAVLGISRAYLPAVPVRRKPLPFSTIPTFNSASLTAEHAALAIAHANAIALTARPNPAERVHRAC